jgi:hypothetical protein
MSASECVPQTTRRSGCGAEFSVLLLYCNHTVKSKFLFTVGHELDEVPMSDAARKSIDQMRMCTYSSPQQCLPIISPDASGKIASKSLIFFVCYGIVATSSRPIITLSSSPAATSLSLVVSCPSQADQLNNSSINYILRTHTHTHRPASITSFIAHTHTSPSLNYILYCAHTHIAQPQLLPLLRTLRLNAAAGTFSTASTVATSPRFAPALACPFTGFRQL